MLREQRKNVCQPSTLGDNTLPAFSQRVFLYSANTWTPAQAAAKAAKQKPTGAVSLTYLQKKNLDARIHQLLLVSMVETNDTLPEPYHVDPKNSSRNKTAARRARPSLTLCIVAITMAAAIMSDTVQKMHQHAEAATAAAATDANIILMGALVCASLVLQSHSTLHK